MTRERSHILEWLASGILAWWDWLSHWWHTRPWRLATSGAGGR